MDMDMDMSMGAGAAAITSSAPTTPHGDDGPMSYFAYSKHTTAIMAHIALMMLAWCIVLPAGKQDSKMIFASSILK